MDVYKCKSCQCDININEGKYIYLNEVFCKKCKIPKIKFSDAMSFFEKMLMDKGKDDRKPGEDSSKLLKKIYSATLIKTG
jgi:hypothetical protein